MHLVLPCVARPARVDQRTHSNYDATNFASRASWLRTSHRDLLVFVLASSNVISISPTSTVFSLSAVSVLSTRQHAYKGNGVRSLTDSWKGQQPAAGIVPQWSILSTLNLKRQHRLDFCIYMVFSLCGTGKGAGKTRLQIRDSANTGSSKTIIPRDF